MAGSTTFTMTLGDIATITAIMAFVCGALGVYIRLFVTAELVRQENRITEKVKLQFAEKQITDLQMSEIKKDVDELKKESNHPR